MIKPNLKSRRRIFKIFKKGGFKPAFLVKVDASIDDFCEFYKIYRKMFFLEKLQMAERILSCSSIKIKRESHFSLVFPKLIISNCEISQNYLNRIGKHITSRQFQWSALRNFLVGIIFFRDNISTKEKYTHFLN